MELIVSNHTLWKQCRDENSADAREALIESYLPFSRMLAAKLYSRRAQDDVDFGDYHHLAIEGLIQAVDKFNPDLGVDFRHYAAKRIEGNVLDGIAKFTEVREQLAMKRDKIKDRIDKGDLQRLSSKAAKSEIFDVLVEMSVGLAVGFMLEDTGLFQNEEATSSGAMDAYRTVEWKQLLERLKHTINKLKPSHQKIIELHYFQGISFTDISNIMNLTKGRVSQLHKAALHELKKDVFEAEWQMTG